MSFLYILEIKPLSKVSFENIFSHTFGSVFILLLFYLVIQKLYFSDVPFVYSFLYVPSQGDISVKILVHGIFENFLPVFFSRLL